MQRALADLGIERDQIGAVARIGARTGAEGIHLRDALAQARSTQEEGTPEPLTGLAAIVAQLWQAAAETDLGRRVRLRLVWRSAYNQVRAELQTYSPRELMADLRYSRSEIDDLATEGADERVAAFIAANPSFRRVAFARRAPA